MVLGLELVTLVPLTLIAPAYIELFLSAGKHVIPASFGKDEYTSTVILAPHSRVAATGRKCLFLNHQRPTFMVQAGPAELVDMSHCANKETSLHLFLSSSLSITCAQLAQDFCLNLVTPRGSQLMVCDPDLIEYSGNGKFVINLGSCLAHITGN
ncbi:MAG: hypothetical protein ACOX2T_08810 [bacterium]